MQTVALFPSLVDIRTEQENYSKNLKELQRIQKENLEEIKRNPRYYQTSSGR